MLPKSALELFQAFSLRFSDPGTAQKLFVSGLWPSSMNQTPLRGLGPATDGLFMMNQYPNGVQIDQTHSGAICQEIGEKLRASLTANPNRLPPRIVDLMERFDSVDRSNAAFKASIGMDAR
jgi:hypothetical protein